ncbi:MAG: lysophospholipid acyltransferase family protein, partial [Gemmatimonadota bacterium]
MLYAILRSVASLALRWYYRGIEVLGLERFPAHGPAILVANHWNALVDALIIGTAVRRPVRLTAKATLLEHPVTRLLVRALGIIPLRRASDETHGDVPVDHSRNANAFTAVLDALEHGEVVLIFPEGRSHSEPSLAPLKSGAARLALMARSERGLADIPIIPIGLTFEHKERPRSRVMMHVGPPITADSPLRIPAGLSTPPQTSGANPSAQVQALTAQIDDALRQLTLNFPTPEDA